MKFLTGDIVFVMHTGSRLSRVIAWFMKSKWSHSAIVAGKMGNTTMLCETSDLQSGYNILDRYIDDPKCSVRVYRRPFTLDEKRIIFNNSKKQNGIPYGWFQLLSLALRRIVMRVTGKRIKNFIRQGQVCCATVGYCLAGSGEFDLAKRDPESYDTQELEDMMQANGFKIVYEKLVD